MAYWNLVLQQRNGSALTEMPGARSVRFSFYLNRPCTASCTLPVTSAEATRANIVPGAREMIAYRNGSPVETVFALTGTSVAADRDNVELQLEFQGILCYLSDALVYGRASAYSSTTLPFTWNSTFQARAGASYGITAGTQYGTTSTRSRYIQQDACLLDEIINLSESSPGFDFNIDTDRAFNEWHTKRGADNGLALEYGSNIVAFDYDENAGPGEIVSDLRVVGPSGSGNAKTATSATAQAAYGRREASVAYLSDVESATVTSSQLQKYADQAVSERALPLITPTVTLQQDHPSTAWGTYWLGDTVALRAKLGGYIDIDASYRIIAIHVDLDDAHNETIRLELNPV